MHEAIPIVTYEGGEIRSLKPSPGLKKSIDIPTFY